MPTTERKPGSARQLGEEQGPRACGSLALDALLAELGIDRGDAGGDVTLLGEDPILPSRLCLAAAFGVPVMACAVGAAAIWRMRGGTGQDLELDLRRAIHGINPSYTWHPTLNGLAHPHALALENFFTLAPYRTRDERIVMASGVYPHMVSAWLRFLDCPPEWEQLVKRFGQWDSHELEQRANAEGLPATVARTPGEWVAHPHGAHLAGTPVIRIEKLADSPPQPLPADERPLSGVRVLSFTHAVAGPTVGRTLAEHGADVLNATFPNHFEHDFIYNEANVGSRSANLDLRLPEHSARVRELLRDADVLVDNHRPGKLASNGFDQEHLRDANPGMVHVSVSAFGADGPWGGRAGFDMNGSAAAGVMALEGGADEPRLPPTGLLNDFITGYLGAAGATAALIRRAREGGSYRVSVNLARTAMFVASLGTVDPALAGSAPEHTLDPEPDAVVAETPMGRLEQLAPPVRFGATPPAWRDPILVPRGSSRAQWL
jgi:crotonobetainyl-CoA:carnitine CoA-transferase CaiB-like acyl-CoA transferase